MLKYLYGESEGEGLLDAHRISRHLHHVLHTEGVFGCALVDSGSGALLAGEQRGDQCPDLGAAAAASAQVMRSQQEAVRQVGLDEPVDELMLTAGNHQQVMRTLSRRRDLFLLALLDKRQANMALARFKIAEAEKALA